MEEIKNFNQNTPERFQSIEDFSFEEVEPNTEGAIGVSALPGEEFEVTKRKVIEELKNKNWWLQDEWHKEGIPNEQFIIENNRNKYCIFNFNKEFSQEQTLDIIKAISFFNQVEDAISLGNITFLIKKNQSINPASKEPFYGKHEGNSVISLSPRALEIKSYREIPEISGLEATVVHELGHQIQSQIFFGEVGKKWKDFGWEDLRLAEKKESGDSRYERPTNPEKCITKYAQYAQDEDLCESIVGLYAKSAKLDSAKKAFLENIFNKKDDTSLVKINKKEKVELPKIDTKIKFFKKKPISIIKKNIEEIPKKENNLGTLNFNDLVVSNISKPHIGSNKFYEQKDNLNKIVRVESFDELLDKHDNKIVIPELIETTKKLYKELEEKYGIVAPVDFATSKDNDGKDIVCVITDKIEGQNLEKVENGEEFVNKVEKLYSAVAKYFFDKSKDGGLYVWDINGESQYIYGKKLGDKEDKIYLIDTDIWLSKNKNDMYLSVYWLARHMSWLESKLGVKFIEARNSINEFINQPLPKDADESVEKNIDGIKKIMTGEKSEYNPESAIPRFE